jgi:hypothetical protein
MAFELLVEMLIFDLFERELFEGDIVKLLPLVVVVLKVMLV